MTVRQWMQTTVRSVGPESDLLRAWRMMIAYQIRHLPVLTQAGKLVGILSDRDIKKHALPPEKPDSPLARQEHLEAIKVSAVMVPNIITVPPEASMEFAAHLMRHHRIDSLPVVEDGKFIGILTSSDLLAYIPRMLGSEQGGRLISITIPAEYSALGETLSRVQTVRGHVPNLLVHNNGHTNKLQVIFAASPRQAEQARTTLGGNATIENLP